MSAQCHWQEDVGALARHRPSVLSCCKTASARTKQTCCKSRHVFLAVMITGWITSDSLCYPLLSPCKLCGLNWNATALRSVMLARVWCIWEKYSRPMCCGLMGQICSVNWSKPHDIESANECDLWYLYETDRQKILSNISQCFVHWWVYYVILLFVL